jgi:hypothetical protein
VKDTAVSMPPQAKVVAVSPLPPAPPRARTPVWVLVAAVAAGIATSLGVALALR